MQIVGETRKIIGPDVRLMVDYNQSQTVTSAVERIRRLSEFDLAGAVLTERLLPEDGMVTARGPGLGILWDETPVLRHAWH